MYKKISFNLFELISFGIVVLIIVFGLFMTNKPSTSYASSDSDGPVLTILKQGTVPSNAGNSRDKWEYTIYAVDDLFWGSDTKYYIEYYSPKDGNIELIQLINK